jgi:hypothetical protein
MLIVPQVIYIKYVVHETALYKTSFVFTTTYNVQGQPAPRRAQQVLLL